MMEFVRARLKDSIAIKIFLGVLALSFGIFGVGDFVGGNSLAPSIALKVGSTEVRTDTLQRRFTQEVDRFRQAMGGQQFDDTMIKRATMGTLLRNLTGTAALMAAGKDMGVEVTRDELRDTIIKLPVFQVDGKFSQTRFNEVLMSNNIQEPLFLEEVRGDLSRSAMLQPVAVSASAPKYLIDSLFDFRNETRVADTLLLPASAMPVEKLPTDEQFKAVYDKHIAEFTSPEYRKLIVLTLTANDLVKPESIEESEIKAYYDANAARYTKPASKNISQLIFDTKAQADAARAQAAPGDNLAAIATKAKAGGVIDLGALTATSPLVKTIGDAFKLPAHEISQPIQTPLGWHLFEVTSETAEHVDSFEAVKDAARKNIAADKAADAVYEASTRVEDAMAAGTPFADIAKSVGGHITTIEAVNQDGKDPKGANVPNEIDPKNFLATAFQTAEGKDSRLMDTPARDGYYAVHVEKVTPPTPKPIEELRPQIVALWEAEQRTALAEAEAAKLVANIGASTQLSALATADKRLSYAPLGPTTRFGTGLQSDHLIDAQRVSPDVLDRVFKAKPGDVFAAKVSSGMLIVRLKEIVESSPEALPAGDLQQIELTLRNEIGSNLIDQMAKAFEDRYPAEMNQKIIDAMIAR